MTTKLFENIWERLSWRVPLAWTAVAAAVSLFACFAPMTQSLSYEFALVVALVASLGAGHIASLYPSRQRGRPLRFEDRPLGAFIMWSRIVGYCAPLAILPLLIGLLNGLRSPMCNAVEGLSFYGLLVLPAIFFAGALGMLAGLSFESRNRAAAAWFLLYVALLIAGVCRFHGSPAVYVFGPLFGYFPGVLYDELVTVEARLVTYRLVTLCQVVALLCFAQCFFEASSRLLAFDRRRWLSRACMGAIVSLGVVVAFYAFGPALGHRVTREVLEEELALKKQVGNLELFFASTTDPQVVDQLTEDATFSLHSVEEYFGVRAQSPIAVFLFPDEASKARAMGALGTNVAKPWRKEVYVTLQDPPHWVLRHEIAHALAAEFGSGPFAVSGKAWGLLPSPGLIEGLAVAATGPRDEMTLHQWVAAMKQLDMLPDLKKVLGLGFFGVATSVAYVVAGSFADWIRSEFGAETLRTAYRMGSYEKATGASLELLEKRWLDSLVDVDLTPLELAAASHRFDRPAVVHGVCIHEVARLRHQAEFFAATRQWKGALTVLEAAHKKSGGSTATHLALFNAKIDAGRMGEVLSEAALLMDDPRVSDVSKDAIREVLADLEMVTGNRESARRSFHELAARAPNEVRRRALEIKAYLAKLPPSAASRLPDILARRPGQNLVPEGLALLLISEAAYASAKDPVFWYLLGRQYFRYYDWDRAIARLDRAIALNIEKVSPSLWLEIRMVKAQCLFRQRRYDEARVLFEQVATDSNVRLGLRLQAVDWVRRCGFRAARPTVV